MWSVGEETTPFFPQNYVFSALLPAVGDQWQQYWSHWRSDEFFSVNLCSDLGEPCTRRTGTAHWHSGVPSRTSTCRLLRLWAVRGHHSDELTGRSASQHGRSPRASSWIHWGEVREAPDDAPIAERKRWTANFKRT